MPFFFTPLPACNRFTFSRDIWAYCISNRSWNHKQSSHLRQTSYSIVSAAVVVADSIEDPDPDPEEPLDVPDSVDMPEIVERLSDMSLRIGVMRIP